jgi:sulfur dioxygenase
MIFRQLFDHASFTYTYLIGSRKGGEALIIDPVLEKVDHYLQLFEQLDLKLVKAIDTHLHADHITGLGALRDKTHCITMMGEKSKVDVVSMRVADGDKVGIEGISLQAIYTPGHTDDSYCFVMEDRVFTGDTLFIRGTGRTDFQNGDARAQYDSIFRRLLTLPEDTLVYPGHDYKGDTVSSIAEERDYNPRLQVSSADEYAALMNALNLPNPRMMDVAVPANMHVGLHQDLLRESGQGLVCSEALALIGRPDVLLVDLREKQEIQRHGRIAGSLNVPYQELEKNLGPSGLLSELVRSTGKRLLFYCAHGERSAMAVQDAEKFGIGDACHIEDGIEGWKSMGGPLAGAE